MKNYYLPEGYITVDLVNKTNKQSIKNAYDRNNLSIIRRGGCWYMEGCPDRIYNTIKKEMEKHYPTLRYLYDKTK